MEDLNISEFFEHREAEARFEKYLNESTRFQEYRTKVFENLAAGKLMGEYNYDYRTTITSITTSHKFQKAAPIVKTNVNHWIKDYLVVEDLKDLKKYGIKFETEPKQFLTMYMRCNRLKEAKDLLRKLTKVEKVPVKINVPYHYCHSPGRTEMYEWMISDDVQAVAKRKPDLQYFVKVMPYDIIMQYWHRMMEISDRHNVGCDGYIFREIIAREDFSDKQVIDMLVFIKESGFKASQTGLEGAIRSRPNSGIAFYLMLNYPSGFYRVYADIFRTKFDTEEMREAYLKFALTLKFPIQGNLKSILYFSCDASCYDWLYDHGDRDIDLDTAFRQFNTAYIDWTISKGMARSLVRKGEVANAVTQRNTAHMWWVILFDLYGDEKKFPDVYERINWMNERFEFFISEIQGWNLTKIYNYKDRVYDETHDFGGTSKIYEYMRSLFPEINQPELCNKCQADHKMTDEHLVARCDICKKIHAKTHQYCNECEKCHSDYLKFCMDCGFCHNDIIDYCSSCQMCHDKKTSVCKDCGECVSTKYPCCKACMSHHDSKKVWCDVHQKCHVRIDNENGCVDRYDYDSDSDDYAWGYGDYYDGYADPYAKEKTPKYKKDIDHGIKYE